MKKPFEPIPGPFGIRHDEQRTQDAFVEYVGGYHQAEKIDRLSKLYPNDEAFRKAAQREGFTDLDIDAFLSL